MKTISADSSCQVHTQGEGDWSRHENTEAYGKSEDVGTDIWNSRKLLSADYKVYVDKILLKSHLITYIIYTAWLRNKHFHPRFIIIASTVL